VEKGGFVVEKGGFVAEKKGQRRPATSARRLMSSTGIGAIPVGFLVFHSKVVHFPVDAYDWRGTCKPIAHDENGYRRCKSTGRDECSVALFLGVYH
jgi:hypothetical protein